MFVGKRDKVILQGKDLSDLYALEQGGKNAGAKKIMIKHAGIEKTGGLSNDELLNIMDVVRNGKIADDSFELRDEIIRYAYDLKKEGINFRVVIDEFNDGKKIFDYYSDRNFIDYGTTQKRLTGNKTFQSAPMDRVSRQTAGTSTLPTPLSAADKTALKQDANSAGEAYSSATDSIIPQNSAKDENGNFDAEKFAKGFIYGLFGSKVTAEQGSKIEQAEAKQEAVKGEGWTMKDGGEAKTDYVIKTDLAPNVRDLSKITTDEISADLEYLAGKHPEIFDKPSDVFRLVKDIKENPTHFFTNNRLDYALIVKRLKNNKIGKLAIDKQSGEVKHATKVKDKDLKRLAKVSEEKSGNAGIIQTFTRPGSKLENQGLGYQDEAIISQKGNLVNEKEANELKSLSKEYDVEQFLKDREGILAKDARYGKTRFSESRIEDNGGVGGWEYKRTPAGYDKN